MYYNFEYSVFKQQTESIIKKVISPSIVFSFFHAILLRLNNSKQERYL